MDICLSISISPPPVLLLPLPKLLLADAPFSPMSIPLPPEAIYSSKEELYTLIQAWTVQHNYAFYIGQFTKISNSSRVKITYNCNYYGPLLPKNHPQGYL
jgi:hypothetical protein